MLAQRLNTERQGRKSFMMWFLTLSAAVLFLAADVMSAAQTYEFSQNIRRMGNQIGVEIWVKSLDANAAKLGNCTYSINYRTDFLDPADPSEYVYYESDSVITDVNQAATTEIPNYPYQVIESPFHSNNGYSAITVNTGSDYPDGSGYGYSEIEIRFSGDATSQGYQPATTGRGTFVAMMVFDIVNYSTLSDTSTVGAGHHVRAYPTYSINDVNDVNYPLITGLSFVDAAVTNIQGITILNPNGPYESVDRDAQYLSLPVAGYPVYFERSGLLNTGTFSYGTNPLAYEVTYSVDGGTSWTDVMRFAETPDSIKASQYDNYASGELETRYGGVPGYIVTQANGSPLTSGGTGYGGVVRVIWSDNSSFTGRSEKAKLKFQQLATTGTGSDIDDRSLGTISGQSAFEFSLSRSFFVQFDGSTQYMRTATNYSNATQLTVEAWVNLNAVGLDGSGYEPGIVVSSAGTASPEEGAWMLYLKDGKYPAFRARTETWPIENNVPFYIETLVSSDSLVVASSNFDLINDSQSETHRNNWTHIAATVKNDSMSLYVNGKIVVQKSNQITSNIRMKQTNHPIWIGVNPNVSIDATDYLNAGVKEVKVWRIALSADEIQQNAAGVYDPIGETTPISEVDSDNDLRLGLELYYSLAANRIDIASHLILQNGVQDINFYENGSMDNSKVVYRPDKSHIKLITPTGGEGISNLENDTYTIKWIGHGLGSLDPSSKDLAIEFLRADGSGLWEYATDNTVAPAGLYLDEVEIEDGSAIWEPYNNVTVSGQYNDLQGVGSTIAQNYNKIVYLRISGTSANSQTEIYDISDPLYLSPYFSLRNKGEAIVYVEGTSKLNLTSNVTFLEAWIRPYRFPTALEEFFPIISKLDSTTDIGHYSFRLLPSGRLQFNVTNSAGTVLSTTSDATLPIAEPGVEDIDTTWFHVGVLVNLANSTGESNVRFYIDGVPQTADSITTGLGSAVSVNDANEYPVFFGYEPGATQSVSFIGEMKEIRFWSGYPAGMSLSGIETAANPTEVTKFIQGALTIHAEDLLTTSTNYQENLIAAFSLNGGSFVNAGKARSIPSTDSDIQAFIVGDISTSGNGASYASTTPYIKIVEPIYDQKVPNTTTDLRVRWVGFDYDVVGFDVGDAADSADIDWSTGGGAGLEVRPWTPVASANQNAAYTNSLSLETTDLYRFSGVSSSVQFAAKLNVSIADPDDNGDYTYNDQAEIPPAKTNARLRIRGRATINSASAYEYTDMSSLLNPGPLFNITPPSNFTVRVLLEGFHSGSDQAMTEVGTSYDNLGLKISMFDDVAGNPGTKVDSAESIEGYDSDASALDATVATTRGSDGSRFANVPFVFTELYDGSYYVVVEHLNHLPIMSRFTAPFFFDGDVLSTWSIESGWDFQSWGQNSTPTTSNYMSASTDDKYSGNGLFSAYGQHEIDNGENEYDKTGLIFNQGRETSSTNRMAAMVAGDVYRDGQINASDRIQVRSDNGSNVARSDVTGDGQVNGSDRDIVDRNGDKLSSLIDISVVSYANGKQVQTPMFAYMSHENPLDAVSDIDPMRSDQMNEIAKKFNESGKVYEPRIYNGKKTALAQSSVYSYKVYAEPYMDGDNISVTLYLKNEGSEFAPGNCTFAFTYETDKLEYIYEDYIKDAEDNPFNNNQGRGYNLIFSTPDMYASNPIPNVRTIDIDYDGYSRPKGVLCPNEKTMLGTLNFRIKNQADEYSFKWHKLSVLLTVDGNDITKDGDWEVIEIINVTRKAIVELPNGGESWSAGRLYSIEWSRPTASSIVHIEYSIDNGSSWNRITENPVDISKRAYRWKTPRVNSTECLIRLVDFETGATVDMSDNPFSLIPIGADIIRPALADGAYLGGESDFIKWIMDDATNVIFEFAEDGVSDWQVVETEINSNLEQMQWTLPSVNSKYAKVRMIDVETGDVLAVSQRFLILAGKLNITEPANGNALDAGQNTAISWSATNVSRFDLHFSGDNGATWEEIARDVNASDSDIDWIVPAVQETENAIIRAVYNNDPEMEYSRVVFAISPTGVNDNSESGFTFHELMPNPFFGKTKVQFTIPFNENITITVINNVGKVIAVPVNNVNYPAGSHSLTFADYNLAAGVYYFHINAGVFNKTRRVVKMK